MMVLDEFDEHYFVKGCVCVRFGMKKKMINKGNNNEFSVCLATVYPGKHFLKPFTTFS